MLNNNWGSKSICIDIPAERTYTIHLGGDDQYQLLIDGKPFTSCLSTTGNCFGSAGFYNQTLTAGKHRFELKHLDAGQARSIWFEVYRNNLNQILAARSDADLNTIFSSKSLIGSKFDYQTTSLTGSVCPVGYFYDGCSTTPRCVKVETTTCTR